MADIFKEVDEDLRRDQAGAFLKKYRNPLIAIVAVVLLAVAGIQAWQWWDGKQRAEQAERYAQALSLLQEGDSLAAAAELGAVAQGGGSYAVLAAFNEARLLAENGDLDKAVVIWDHLADDSAAGPALRGAARLISVMHQVDSGDPAALQTQLAPLQTADNGYRPLALDLSGALALRQGDLAAARGYYTQVVDDLQAPPGLRTRAALVLAALKEPATE